MERDMGTTIATKSDLQMLRQELVAMIGNLAIREETQDIRSDIALVRKDMEMFSTTMTVRLGFMLIVGLSVPCAALKLTGKVILAHWL
jgi:hypothetical protein